MAAFITTLLLQFLLLQVSAQAEVNYWASYFHSMDCKVKYGGD